MRAPGRFRLWVILAVGLVARSIAAYYLRNAHVSWGLEYEEIAANLLKDGSYSFSFYNLTPPLPTSFIPPVYPLLLFFFQWVGDSGGIMLLKIFQVLASSSAIIGVYLLARSLEVSRGQAELTALFMALYPPAVAYAGDISTVTIEITLVVFGTWGSVIALRRRSLGAAFGSGVAWTLAALTRSPWLVVIPLMAIWILLFAGYPVRDRLRTVVIFFIASSLVILPWTARNYATHHTLVLTSTNGGLNFWIGNNPSANGEYTFPTETDASLVQRSATMSEAARDIFYYREGLEFIRNNPVKALQLAGAKFIYYWFFRPNIGSNYTTLNLPVTLAGYAFIIAWIGLLPLSIIGVRTLKETWKWHGLLAAILISQSFVYMIYFVGTRYRTPADGYVMVWGAIGLSLIWSKWRQTSRQRITTNG